MSKQKTILSGAVILTLFLYGCSTQPIPHSSPSNTSPLPSQSRVKAPSSQYKDVLRNSIGGGSVSNIEIHYIRDLDASHSICLFTFEQRGKTLFNEACLAKRNGKWSIYYASSPEPISNAMPVYNMSLSATFGKSSKPKLTGASEFLMVGGIIHDPAVVSLALVEPTGKLFRKLKILHSGNMRLYAYGQLIREGKPAEWTVKAYDKNGKAINLTNT